jgi:hypothetical protein
VYAFSREIEVLQWDGIKMNLKIAFEEVFWIHQVQNMLQWWVLVNTINEYDNVTPCCVILINQIIFKLSI